MRVGELASELLEPFLGAGVMGFAPGGSQPPAHEGPVTLGQVPQDVPLLVTDAALYGSVLAKDIPDCLAQGL